MQENKFKVGAKVKYVGTKNYDDLKIGDVRIITHIHQHADSDEIYGVDLDKVDGYVYPQQLRLVESAEERSYSVEEVIKAFINVYPIGWEIVNVEEVIQKTKEELEKRKNPEYLKYLELKEKFGEQ